MKTRPRSPQLFLLPVAFCLMMVQYSCTRESKEDSVDVEIRLSRLVRVPMDFDARHLPDRTKEILRHLVDAGKLLDEAYLRQYYPPGVALRDSLSARTDEKSRDLYRLVVRNGGPFDKMDEFHPFFGTGPKPPGGGFYPVDLTRGELEQYLKAHPDQRDTLLSPYTVVRRADNGLVAVPYHVEYAEWVNPAANLLKSAAELTDHVPLKRYLESRAAALRTDDYYQSDLDWVDLQDGDIDVVIAPYEVYDDGLMAVKAAYEVTVGIRDKEASDRLSVYTQHLEDLERYLPYDDKYKRPVKGLSSPMVVVTDIYRGGDIATGYQPVAANLPNDPRVHTTKGTKKTFWKNMMDARVRYVIMPIGRELIASDQVKYITPEGLFNFVLLHELSHALGARYVHGQGNLSVNQALSDLYPAIEEGKADVAGLHSLRYFVDAGIIPESMVREHYVSYLASLFRTIRFGTGEAHGKAAISQINYLWDKGGIHRDASSGKWSIDFEAIGPAITSLAREWLTIQAEGDYTRAADFFGTWGRTPKEVQQALDGLEHVPVDVEPVYSITWE